jgi:hypothetical protein
MIFLDIEFLAQIFFGHISQKMIEHTKRLVEDKLATVGGYEHNAEVKLQLPCSFIYT